MTEQPTQRDPQADAAVLEDAAVPEVVSWLRVQDPHGERMAKVFRETFDQIYDGQRTGRYRLDQLFKTEKTHFGTLIEINLQREFKFEDGDLLDFSILGMEIDCKYSHSGQWMIPVEAFEQLLLVAKADDAKTQWSVGVVRATAAHRRVSENRDRKTSLNADGRAAVQWVFKDHPMQPNALLQLPRELVDHVMGQPSGQKRLNELFRVAQNLRLSNNIIATVAQQKDYMKRVRSNGGSRSALKPEGIIILSGDYNAQRSLAGALGAVIPEPGEVVSVTVVPAESAFEGVPIGDGVWRLARLGEEPTTAAPAVR